MRIDDLLFAFRLHCQSLNMPSENPTEYAIHSVNTHTKAALKSGGQTFGGLGR